MVRKSKIKIAKDRQRNEVRIYSWLRYSKDSAIPEGVIMYFRKGMAPFTLSSKDNYNIRRPLKIRRK